MTEGTAIEYAKLKMRELGVGRKYVIRYKHFRLDPSEKRQIKGENYLYLLIGDQENVKVESKAGVYDLKDNGINEMQYAHRGIILLTNNEKSIQDIRFIQVVPLIKKNK